MAISEVISDQEFPTDEEREFVARCSYENLVLAGGSEIYQNDKTAILFKKFIEADTIDFFLEKETNGTFSEVAVLNNNTYGTIFNFGDFIPQPFYKGFLIDWASVLSGKGAGNYRVRIDRATILATDSIFTVEYCLKTFTTALADTTIWLEWIQNGQIIDGLDYTDLNWYQAIRLPGFLGKRQDEFEEELWKDINFVNNQIRNELTFNYLFEAGPIPSCVGRDLDNFKQGNTIQITDYNKNNYDYLIQRKPLKITEINETDYDENRQAIFNYTFSDRTDNHIKINC